MSLDRKAAAAGDDSVTVPEPETPNDNPAAFMRDRYGLSPGFCGSCSYFQSREFYNASPPTCLLFNAARAAARSEVKPWPEDWPPEERACRKYHHKAREDF